MNSTVAQRMEMSPSIRVLKQLLRELTLSRGPINIPKEDQEKCKEMIRNHFIDNGPLKALAGDREIRNHYIEDGRE